MAKKNKMGILLISGVTLALLCAGCAPGTFVKGQSSGWKIIELNENLQGDYDNAWQKTVDTIARDYDIELIDKDSGYLRTSWAHGISGGIYHRYRGRITIKYPSVINPDKMEVKTDAQWLSDPTYGVWEQGWDRNFNRDIFTALSGRLGRTVSPD